MIVENSLKWEHVIASRYTDKTLIELTVYANEQRKVKNIDRFDLLSSDNSDRLMSLFIETKFVFQTTI